MRRGHEDHGRTKPSSTSTWCMNRRPAARELASLQQASGCLEVALGTSA